MKVVQRKEFKIPDHLMIHDWAFTDSHYVLFSNRIKLDILGNVPSTIPLPYQFLFLFFVYFQIFYFLYKKRITYQILFF